MSYRAGIIAAVVATAAAGGLAGCDQVNSSSSAGDICTISRDDVIAQSKVGQAAQERLGNIIEQVHNELNDDRQQLSQSLRDFQEKADDMGEEERNQKQDELQQQQRAFQQKAQQLNARVRLTRARVNQRLNQEADPLIDDVYDDKSCGILLNSAVVQKGDDDKDLTDDVVKALDDETTTINFGLQQLPQQNDRDDDEDGDDNDENS